MFIFQICNKQIQKFLLYKNWVIKNSFFYNRDKYFCWKKRKGCLLFFIKQQFEVICFFGDKLMGFMVKMVNCFCLVRILKCGCWFSKKKIVCSSLMDRDCLNRGIRMVCVKWNDVVELVERMCFWVIIYQFFV